MAETLRGWSRHSSGSYWCLHCNATGDAPGDQDCSNCGGLGWRGEPGATPDPIDDSSPERLRERREALGLSMAEAATIVRTTAPGFHPVVSTPLGFGEWDETSIHYCESPRALLTVRQLDLDRYAAALSAEEARRAKMAAERDAHAVPRLDWLEPASPPAHEVVDVPPEPWHARLVRLAQVAQDTSKACAETEAAFKVADAERERTRLVRAAAREACHAARKALTEATTARAILDAQQPARDRMPPGEPKLLDAEPTRPEPRFKVGDWAADNETGARGIISRAEWSATQAQWRYDMGSVDYPESHLTPALDPALHETARTAARILLCGKWPLRPASSSRRGWPAPCLPRVRELPGFDAWNNGPLTSSEWAAQLERLLGDAP